MSLRSAAICFAVFLLLGRPAIVSAAEDAAANSPAFSSATILLLIVYCLLIALSSFGGGMLPMFVRLTHRRMQFLVSLVGGLMLGVGIFHQLPHAVAIMPNHGDGGLGALDSCMWWLMFGLLLTFFMLRMFHFHSHEPMTEEDSQNEIHDHDCAHDHDHDGLHDHAHSHDHDNVHDHGHGHGPALDLTTSGSWIGIFLGLSLHTLLDGVALAAAVQADALHQHGSKTLALLGVGTFLGVALHKPLDSLSITSLMAAGGWSRTAMKSANLAYALMCPIGAALFCIGIASFSHGREVVVASALAMSAGVFLCISLSDLLPEVQFHSHDRFWLSLMLLTGIGLAWAIGLIEPAHTHGAPDPSTIRIQDGHDHHGHAH